MGQNEINNLLNLFQYDKNSPMIFNSGFFLFLFTVFIIIYQFIYGKQKLKIIYLTLFSFYFYYKSSGFYFVLLIISTYLDYYISLLLTKNNKELNNDVKKIKTWFLPINLLIAYIDKNTTLFFTKGNYQLKRKMLLMISLIGNLGLLGYFKYTNFFIDIINNTIYSLNYILASTGFSFQILTTASATPFEFYDIFLPVGISFYTFQTLSYTIDVYRGKLEPVKGIVDFAFYVSFFPQLVAGPIVRASDFIPQIYNKIVVTNEDFGKAIALIIGGLFKKAVIADYISTNFVDRIFNDPSLYSGVENLMAIYGYALQIYCDFSGYSDIAIGISLLLGYKLNINFDSPYQSSSITEFWRRWHISLSSWLKDYLYISLGGNRAGKIKQAVNLNITMLLGGLWHGANWKFVLWGGLQGLGLTLDKIFHSIFKIPKGNLYLKIAGIIFTFHFTCFSWIFFRADSYSKGVLMLERIFTVFEPELFIDLITGYKGVFILMLIGYTLHFIPSKIELKFHNLIIKSPLVAKSLYITAIIWLVIQVKSSDIQPFIYFQF